ncbi:glycosyltransferase family 2 protein [Formosa undariae]|uniref:Glycosyltransferase family 2 protein n=1 Tax=Formosa undariae TaxID=1325436 RepID=A0ABV5F088_9FLAO
MENQNLISIIIPTFNRASLIGETLDSVQAQTYTYWECIVIDDGSTDGTDQLMSEYIAKDSRFKYLHRPQDRLPGGNAARNYGFELSKGEYVNWFDSDDLMLPDFLSSKLNLLIENDSLDFSACYSQIFKNSPNNIINEAKPLITNSVNYIEDYMFNGLFFDTAGPLWRKSFLIKNNLKFDEVLLRSQERDFHFRILFANPNFSFVVKKHLFLSREGEDNSISKNFSKSFDLQLSNFMYFNNAFNLIYESDIKCDKIKLLRYIFYRQSVHFYTMFTMNNVSLNKQLYFYFKYFPALIKYLKGSKLGLEYFAKICFGSGIMLFFNKGYKFFHFPQFNYRKND